MPPNTPLHSKVSLAFPAIHFVSSSEFRWSPQENSIYYDREDPQGNERLLHEIAHAVLDHNQYDRDIELIALERDAWQHAKTVLGPQFDVTISSDTVEDDLDTYRDWLHARSTCPSCQATGIQTATKEYTCVVCQAVWRVNEAISCGLKRYTKNAL